MKDVLIKIKGIQTTADGNEQTELTTLGKMWRRNGGWSLRYPESEATGMKGAQTTVSFIDETVVMKRAGGGGGKARMTIERDRRHLCHYETGYGEMMVGTFGQNIEHSLSEHGGECFMKYTIDINAAYESMNELHISVSEVKSCQC